MKPQSFSVPLAARRYGVRSRLVLLVAAAALVGSSRGAAQPDAPGEPVTLPGAEISGWGQVGEVSARFGRPAGAPPKVPAVLILHGSGGGGGRGAFYAQALQDAGIATLEITMFRPGGPLGLTFGIVPQGLPQGLPLTGYHGVHRLPSVPWSTPRCICSFDRPSIISERFRRVQGSGHVGVYLEAGLVKGPTGASGCDSR